MKETSIKYDFSRIFVFIYFYRTNETPVKPLTGHEEAKSKLKNEAKAWEMDLGLDDIIGCDVTNEPEVEQKAKIKPKVAPKKNKAQQKTKEKQPPRFEGKGKKQNKK